MGAAVPLPYAHGNDAEVAVHVSVISWVDLIEELIVFCIYLLVTEFYSEDRKIVLTDLNITLCLIKRHKVKVKV